MEEPVYQAPFFNLYGDGRSCPGNHTYPTEVTEIPDSFFVSHFAPEGDMRGRSAAYPDNLLRLWEELDGQDSYPLDDLVHMGPLERVVQRLGR